MVVRLGWQLLLPPVLSRFSSQICGRPSPLTQPYVSRGGTWMEWAEAKPRIWGKEKFMFLLKARLTWDAKKCLNPAVQAGRWRTKTLMWKVNNREWERWNKLCRPWKTLLRQQSIHSFNAFWPEMWLMWKQCSFYFRFSLPVAPYLWIVGSETLLSYVRT